MNRDQRIGLLGGLFAVAVSFAVGPWPIAAWLLWRAWWRQAGVRLSALDGPARLLAAATATLPADRRDWGAAMAAELAQVPVQERAARWRFAAGCARAAIFPPGGSRAAVGVAGALAVTATAAAAGATGAALPAGRVFALTFVGLLGGLATLAVARSRRAGHAGPGPAVAGLGLAGVAACVAFLGYHLAEFPTYHRARLHAWILVSLPPVTAVVLAVLLAGCLWLALRPPRWLLGDRHARRFGVGMAVALVAGFVLASRQELRGLPGAGDAGMMSYVLPIPPLVLLTGSAAAAAVGRSFRSGLRACAWAIVPGAPLLVAAWLAEGLRWYQQGRGMLLDGEGGIGVGANLGDAVRSTLLGLLLWALPLGAVGAAAGSARARRRRAREHGDLPSTT
jgi:hypothetical protein